MTTQKQDKVEREIVVRAPMERVYAALTQPEQFTKWWPRAIEGKFATGEHPVLDFGDFGKCSFFIVAMQPHHYFAYRWAQGAATPEDSIADPRTQPNSLVEFMLEKVDGGTRVRVIESGLASLPDEHYNRSIGGIAEGWRILTGLLEKYLAEN
jgi:uncharacterized protein YndB with AHSA1/START domain